MRRARCTPARSSSAGRVRRLTLWRSRGSDDRLPAAAHNEERSYENHRSHHHHVEPGAPSDAPGAHIRNTEMIRHGLPSRDVGGEPRQKRCGKRYPGAEYELKERPSGGLQRGRNILDKFRIECAPRNESRSHDSACQQSYNSNPGRRKRRIEITRPPYQQPEHTSVMTSVTGLRTRSRSENQPAGTSITRFKSQKLAAALSAVAWSYPKACSNISGPNV